MANLTIDLSLPGQEEEQAQLLNLDGGSVKPLLHIPSNKLGSPTAAVRTNLTPKRGSQTNVVQKGAPRKLSLTDEINPYIHSPSKILKQKMKSESPFFS
eukprot:gene1702-1805_t